MKQNNEFMWKALGIAFDRMGLTSPNPAVGTVIVRDGAVIAEGGTGPCGSSHAEIAALERARGNCRGADMYVTLEPCNHYGRTPPCTLAIIDAGISRVFVPILDPNPLVAGKGIKQLQDAGIEVVVMHDMADPAADLIRPFKKYILRGRPFVMHKSAVTLDGRIATKSGDSKWVSSPFSRYLVHKIRAKADACIIGKNTFDHDNPMMDVRFDQFDDEITAYFMDREPALHGRDNYFIRSIIGAGIEEYEHPLRVVMGLPDTINMESPFFSRNNYLFFESRDKVDRYLRDRGPGSVPGEEHLIVLEASLKEEAVSLALEELAKRGVVFAMLEGGGTLAGSFFDCGEIDQFTYFISPRIAGNGIPSLSAIGADQMSLSLPLRDISFGAVKDDILFNGYKETYNFEMM